MSFLKRFTDKLKPEHEWKKRARNLQGCGVILRGADLFVISLGYRMLGGPGTIAQPTFKHDRSDPTTTIGESILKSLAATQMPLEGRELSVKEEHRLIGVRSEAQLARESRYVSISSVSSDGPITVQIYKAPPGGGFLGTHDSVTCSRERSELGRTVLAMLDRISEPIGARNDIRIVKVKAKWPRGVAWLAIPTNDEESVVTALVENGTTAAVCTAKQKNPAGSVAVYSPMPGWTLAIGGGILPDTDREDFVAWLKAISVRVGEVYYFASYRIVDYAAWAKAENGDAIRAFAYLGEAGEVKLDEGARTPEEAEFWPNGLEFPDQDDVFKIAMRWSVDPVIVVESIAN